MNLFRIQENTEKNKYSLDTLKLILSVMVVFIHSRIFLDSSLILDAFTSNGFFRVAVPIFFIINGYYLPSDKNKFKKWFFSSLYLYIGLTFFYFYFWIDRSSLMLMMFSIIKTLATGFLHLWYIEAMIIAGAIIYFFGACKYIFHLSIVFFVIGWVLQFYHSYQYIYDGDVSYNYLAYRNALTIGLPFMVIGKIFKEGMFSGNIKKAFVHMALVLFCGEIALNYYYFLSKTNNPLDITIDVYLSLIVICPYIFITAMKINYGFIINRKIPNYIYFIHPLPMIVFNKFLPNDNRVIVSILIVISSIFISFVVLKLQPTLNLIIRKTQGIRLLKNK
ncbi:Uncharacterized protein conserved in bacteria [Klebsiella pneumoniae]|uniref:acyltransferase family protein n=1 Tax=Klebsiella pneumoniae TaxID=573 RepID=UPI0010B25440|nr:acyltransferase family protein [Klebsiella pneumoniae]VFZ86535.1 Uncharacterized protein conserved in bacteria [Klebsiella pneumoniae]VGA26477.1 Uncharacterized protein conserved in bacteria [Klebsiella pneumoniae]